MARPLSLGLLVLTSVFATMSLRNFGGVGPKRKHCREDYAFIRNFSCSIRLFWLQPHSILARTGDLSSLSRGLFTSPIWTLPDHGSLDIYGRLASRSSFISCGRSH